LDNSVKEKKMKKLLILTPFLLGNSAPVGGLITFLAGVFIVVGVIIALIYGAFKYFS